MNVLSKYRFERKFLIPITPNGEIESIIKLHSSMFREIFFERSVNNIYLDSPDMLSYFSTYNGVSDRIKFRIRWYGKPFGSIQNPVLEFKKKRGLLGSKLSFPINNFTLKPGCHVDLISELCSTPNIPDTIKIDLSHLKPTLMNSYRRKYFRSADRAFRITVDRYINYYRIGTIGNYFSSKVNDFNHSVLELKYSYDKDDMASAVVDEFPFQIGKNSKYVNGIQMLYN